jgi:hypothetical protein
MDANDFRGFWLNRPFALSGMQRGLCDAGVVQG